MNAELPGLIAELESVTAEAQARFGALTAEQLNWKPSPEKWSVAQCFEHLIKINSEYFDDFDAIISGEKKPSFWEKYSPLSGFFGNLLFKSMSPQAERKLKAPKVATPSASDISPAIIEDFVRHQEELVDKFRRTEGLDTKKIMITSPFIRIITYSLFDAFRVIVTHEKRHFQQATRVMDAEGFPGK